MRKKVFFTLGFIGMIGLLALGVWHQAAYQLESHLKACLSDLHDQGWQISYNNTSLKGFPFGFKMILNYPQLKGPKVTLTEIKELQLNTSLWNWSEVSVKIPGKIRAIYTLQNSSSFTLTSQNFRGIWNIKKKALNQALNIKMDEVILKTASFEGKAESCSLENLPLENSSLFRIQAVADKVAFSPDFKLPFFNQADQIKLTFRFESPQPLLFSAEKSVIKNLAHSLAVEGATVEIEEAIFKKDNFLCHSSGTFSLDSHYQPLAALSTQIQNIEVLLNDLITSKFLSSKNVNMIKLFLFSLQKSAENSVSVHQVPLSLQQGTLSLGPFPLVSFPPFALEDLLE